MEFTFPENALIRGIFTDGSSHSKLGPKFLSSPPRLEEVTHSTRQHSLENLFPPIEERGGKAMICFVKLQSKYMKTTCDIRLFMFCMI